MSPVIKPGPLTWCPHCGWTQGKIETTECLGDYYDSGTPLKNVETYMDNLGPCGCSNDDVGMEEHPVAWECSNCHVWHGDLSDALKCCEDVVAATKALSESLSAVGLAASKAASASSTAFVVPNLTNTTVTSATLTISTA